MGDNFLLSAKEKGQKLKWALSFGNIDRKIAIIGAENIKDYSTYKKNILPLLPNEKFQLIDFYNTDKYIKKLAEENNYNIYIYKFKMDKFNRSGGFIKNIEIVDFLNHFLNSKIIFIENNDNKKFLSNLFDLCSCTDIKIDVVKSQD